MLFLLVLPDSPEDICECCLQISSSHLHPVLGNNRELLQEDSMTIMPLCFCRNRKHATLTNTLYNRSFVLHKNSTSCPDIYMVRQFLTTVGTFHLENDLANRVIATLRFT